MQLVIRGEYPTVREWLNYQRHLAFLKAEAELKSKLFAVEPKPLRIKCNH
jgi:hypothetical protein